MGYGGAPALYSLVYYGILIIITNILRKEAWCFDHAYGACFIWPMHMAQEDLSIHTYLNDRYVEANPKELEILLRQCQVVVRGQAAAQ